jgi:serine phosphatase RsbU (regulator of sigma subunit)
MNTLDELFANGATNPATLLNQLRLVISRRFNTENEQRLDGMDISVFLLNKRSGKLTFAGAQMPLWIIRKTETIELKGQRSPIGLSYGKTELFSNQVIQLDENDKLLLFTDGLTDQFGDYNQKKWGKKGLRKSIFMKNEKNTQQIFNNIMRDFDQWKQAQDQTDDCAVLLFEFEFQKQAQSVAPTLIALNTPNLQAHG